MNRCGLNIHRIPMLFMVFFNTKLPLSICSMVRTFDDDVWMVLSFHYLAHFLRCCCMVAVVAPIAIYGVGSIVAWSTDEKKKEIKQRIIKTGRTYKNDHKTYFIRAVKHVKQALWMKIAFKVAPIIHVYLSVNYICMEYARTPLVLTDCCGKQEWEKQCTKFNI